MADAEDAAGSVSVGGLAHDVGFNVNPNFEEVCELPNGCRLYREPNKAGGYTYYSDEIGGGVMVWDTCLVAAESMLAAIVEERKRYVAEYHAQRISDKER